jgi:hypothetical protein
MPTPILQQMLGQGGTMEFVDAAVSGKNYDFLVVNAAATFTTLTGTGGEDLLTAYAMSGNPCLLVSLSAEGTAARLRR